MKLFGPLRKTVQNTIGVALAAGVALGSSAKAEETDGIAEPNPMHTVANAITEGAGYTIGGIGGFVSGPFHSQDPWTAMADGASETAHQWIWFKDDLAPVGKVTVTPLPAPIRLEAPRDGERWRVPLTEAERAEAQEVKNLKRLYDSSARLIKTQPDLPSNFLSFDETPLADARIQNIITKTKAEQLAADTAEIENATRAKEAAVTAKLESETTLKDSVAQVANLKGTLWRVQYTAKTIIGMKDRKIAELEDRAPQMTNTAIENNPITKWNWGSLIKNLASFALGAVAATAATVYFGGKGAAAFFGSSRNTEAATPDGSVAKQPAPLSFELQRRQGATPRQQAPRPNGSYPPESAVNLTDLEVRAIEDILFDEHRMTPRWAKDITPSRRGIGDDGFLHTAFSAVELLDENGIVQAQIRYERVLFYPDVPLSFMRAVAEYVVEVNERSRGAFEPMPYFGGNIANEERYHRALDDAWAARQERNEAEDRHDAARAAEQKHLIPFGDDLPTENLGLAEEDFAFEMLEAHLPIRRWVHSETRNPNPDVFSNRKGLLLYNDDRDSEASIGIFHQAIYILNGAPDELIDMAVDYAIELEKNGLTAPMLKTETPTDKARFRQKLTQARARQPQAGATPHVSPEAQRPTPATASVTTPPLSGGAVTRTEAPGAGSGSQSPRPQSTARAAAGAVSPASTGRADVRTTPAPAPRVAAVARIDAVSDQQRGGRSPNIRQSTVALDPRALDASIPAAPSGVVQSEYELDDFVHIFETDGEGKHIFTVGNIDRLGPDGLIHVLYDNEEGVTDVGSFRVEPLRAVLLENGYDLVISPDDVNPEQQAKDYPPQNLLALLSEQADEADEKIENDRFIASRGPVEAPSARDAPANELPPMVASVPPKSNAPVRGAAERQEPSDGLPNITDAAIALAALARRPPIAASDMKRAIPLNRKGYDVAVYQGGPNGQFVTWLGEIAHDYYGRAGEAMVVIHETADGKDARETFVGRDLQAALREKGYDLLILPRSLGCEALPRMELDPATWDMLDDLLGSENDKGKAAVHLEAEKAFALPRTRPTDSASAVRVAAPAAVAARTSDKGVERSERGERTDGADNEPQALRREGLTATHRVVASAALLDTIAEVASRDVAGYVRAVGPMIQAQPPAPEAIREPQPKGVVDIGRTLRDTPLGALDEIMLLVRKFGNREAAPAISDTGTVTGPAKVVNGAENAKPTKSFDWISYSTLMSRDRSDVRPAAQKPLRYEAVSIKDAGNQTVVGQKIYLVKNDYRLKPEELEKTRIEAITLNIDSVTIHATNNPQVVADGLRASITRYNGVINIDETVGTAANKNVIIAALQELINGETKSGEKLDPLMAADGKTVLLSILVNGELIGKTNVGEPTSEFRTVGVVGAADKLQFKPKG
jgi:hypothetical protein